MYSNLNLTFLSLYHSKAIPSGMFTNVWRK